MTVLASINAAMYSTLQAGTALTALLAGTASIYNLAAPDGAAFPFVVFNHQGGGPDNQTHADMESNVYWVRAYSEQSAKASEAIFEQADALLHKRNLSLSGGITMYWCHREQNVQMEQQAQNNRKVWATGGLYRIRTTGG